jgi:uncharacterized protein
MKLSSRSLLSALFLVLVSAKGHAPQPVSVKTTERPALWKLADADTTIYLFGTIHALPKGFAWRTPALDKAMARAKTLVLEVPDLSDKAGTTATFRRLAISPNLPPLLERVPEDKRAQLTAMLDHVKIPAIALNGFESWAAAVTLASLTLADAGVSPENGVEEQLTKLFRAAKKPIIGLETTEQQLGFFDALSEDTQRAFLVSIVDQTVDAKAEFAAMIDAWRRGDDKAIALTFDDELKLSPELAEALIRKRNANWTQWLADRLARPGTIFVAVGAGHLAGDASLQIMLAKRGLTVTRIQ